MDAPALSSSRSSAKRSWTASWPFAVNAASFAVSAALITRAGPAPRHPEKSAEVDAAVKVTVRALLRRPAVLLAAVQLSGLAAVLQLRYLILPAYVRYALQQSALAYGLLEGLYALGALSGAALSRRTDQRTLAALLILSLALISLAPHLKGAAMPVSAASFFALGLALSTRLSIWAQLQTDVPSEFQGRVHALINGLISATVLSAVLLSTVSVTLRSAAALYFVLAGLALLFALTERLRPPTRKRAAKRH